MDKKEFVRFGLYTNRYGHISIYVGDYPDSEGRIRPYFVELRKAFASNEEIMRYLNFIDIEKLTETVLGESVDCHYVYDYGFLGIVQEPVLTKLTERIDYVMTLPFEKKY